MLNAAKLSLLSLLLLPAAISASELPDNILPAGVGVNIHFVKGREQDLDLIVAGGFKFVRMDFVWESTERKVGEYDWSDYDELTRNLERRGLSALYILDYSNPLHEKRVIDRTLGKTEVPRWDTAAPQHSESIAAFARWAAAAAKHFHGRHIIWEIWNEPNGIFWKPEADAAQYSALALAAAAAIRQAEPQATIIGPALAGFQPAYMKVFLESGVLKYLDAVSVHPYREPSFGPETAGPDYARLRALIERCAPAAGKKTVPIISGEWGYHTDTHGNSTETQAAFLVRQQLFNLLNGVTLSIWYDWKNDGTNINEGEENFGTVTYKLEPKPAYRAVKVLTRELAGYHIEHRFDTSQDDYVLLLTDASGRKKIAAWTAGKPHTADLKPALKANEIVAGVDGWGSPLQLQSKDEPFAIRLEALPQYYTLKPSQK